MLYSKIDDSLDKYVDLVGAWIGGKGFGKFNLTPEQLVFVTKHDFYFTTAYIGMVRCYYQNRPIWQTSCFDSILSAMDNKNTIFGRDNKQIYNEAKRDYDNLSLQVRDFIQQLIELPEEELDNFLNNSFAHLLSN